MDANSKKILAAIADLSKDVKTIKKDVKTIKLDVVEIKERVISIEKRLLRIEPFIPVDNTDIIHKKAVKEVIKKKKSNSKI